MSSEREIVEGLKCGSREGVRRLLEVYRSRLIREATVLFRVPLPDAEELVNDVLLTAVQKIHTFEFRKGEGDFNVWVVAVFRNRVRDFFRLRAGAGQGLLSLDAVHDDGMQVEDPDVDPVGEIARAYREERRSIPGGSRPDAPAACLKVIAETLDAMETWERVLLRCRALDIPYEEIAGYTGKSPRQLMVYHARVRKRFIRKLAQHYPELQRA